MSSAYSDRNDYSEQGLNPDLHVVPPSPQYDSRQQNDENDPLRELIEPEKANAQVEQPPALIEWHHAIVAVDRFVTTLISPFVKVAFASQTQRAVVNSLVVIIVVAWIILTSFTAYLTFYQRYIPKAAHIEPIYFQYADIEQPRGKVYFSGPDLSMPLRYDQAYDVSVQLHVAASDVNFDLGNFMVQVQLLTGNGTVLAESSRPVRRIDSFYDIQTNFSDHMHLTQAILRYQSHAQRILHVMAKALPLLIGWTEESQHINLVLLESYIEKKAAPITQAHVTLSTSKLQVYDAHISVIADFRGLRYYMYHRRISTASAFVVLFTMIEIVCALAAWKMFGKNLWVKLHELFSVDEDNDVASQYNTEEEDEDGYLTEE
ncbi:hypothetical protein [Parasitella parasitica]|uniref:Seipin n=1 Tax=Parasitella parasitica TaxID=35722 RepID=A0A0B7MW70_9FUNG|nr:hypothetical protein [Parasitella parasitica]